jgi:GT2 family glycosyltransferase
MKGIIKLISIIIPNYNGESYIKQCMDSVYNQTCKEFEIIVVDNASKDNSIKIIQDNFKNVKIIDNKNNLGFSVAVNQGIIEAKGEYIVLLNNDTEVHEYWLNNLVKCIENDEKVFSCCSKMIRYLERDKIDDTGDEYNLLGWAYKRGDGESIDKYNKNQSVFSSCGGAAIYRKRVFDEIGYFDENFFAYMEDVDISYRAKIHGYKNIYCSDAVVYHIGSATSGSKYNSFKIKLAARNNLYVVYKNMPILQLALNMPFILLGWIIRFLFFYKKGFGKEYLEGTKEAFSKLKNISKVKYIKKNLFNYAKIEFEIILNMFKYAYMKIFKL